MEMCVYTYMHTYIYGNVCIHACMHTYTHTYGNATRNTTPLHASLKNKNKKRVCLVNYTSSPEANQAGIITSSSYTS